MFRFPAGQDAAASHRLRAPPPFAGLKVGELNIVEGFMHERRYLPGEIVFDGAKGQALPSSFRARGDLPSGAASQPIAELGAGDFSANWRCLTTRPLGPGLARQSNRAAVLFRGDFERLMQSHAPIASQIAMQLARHLGPAAADHGRGAGGSPANETDGGRLSLRAGGLGGVISSTCLVSSSVQKMLWLVVPSSLALMIIYYALLPGEAGSW